MAWWIWMVVGLVCCAAELLTPGGIVMIFIGAAALVVGLLSAVGLGGPLWLQVLMFSVLSVVSLLTLRGPLLRRIQVSDRGGEVDQLAGEEARLLDALAAGDTGRAELRGSVWRVRNRGEADLPAGSVCPVERVHGLELEVSRALRRAPDRGEVSS